MKKIIALFMTLCILCSMIPATYAMAAEPKSTTANDETALRAAVELGRQGDGSFVLAKLKIS